MPHSVSSDAVDTVDATLARAGRTDRPKVRLPEDADLPVDGGVRLALDGRTRHAQVERAIDGTVEIRGAYDNPRLARESGGENRLVEWFEDRRLDFGRTVRLDVIDAGYCYGLRAPGERAVYEVSDRPDDALSDIAEEVGR